LRGVKSASPAICVKEEASQEIKAQFNADQAVALCAETK
tara:strand:+ start:37233 stop:37349 length:117 start_codon:yes stop_codon:yes gene_type:complete